MRVDREFARRAFEWHRLADLEVGDEKRVFVVFARLPHVGQRVHASDDPAVGVGYVTICMRGRNGHRVMREIMGRNGPMSTLRPGAPSGFDEPHRPFVGECRAATRKDADQAIAPLRKAVELTNNQPLIAASLGHALIATEDKDNLAEATQVLKAAINKDNQNPFAWYQLGIVYEQQGDTPHAALATAERYLMEGTPQLALPNATEALAGLPADSPDWLRAKDVQMVAEAQMVDLKKRR